jgi:small subunit ribosomal protein S24e
MNIEKDFNNRLLKRRELNVAIEYEGNTPSREEIRSGVADKYNMNKECMLVIKVEQLYGTNTVNAIVHEYADKEALGAAQKHLFERPHKGKKKAQDAGNQEAAPKEEKKEEPKAEEAKE